MGEREKVSETCGADGNEDCAKAHEAKKKTSTGKFFMPLPPSLPRDESGGKHKAQYIR
jgi:hypothetical protein